jgi:hypothetical protein
MVIKWEDIFYKCVYNFAWEILQRSVPRYVVKWTELYQDMV